MLATKVEWCRTLTKADLADVASFLAAPPPGFNVNEPLPEHLDQPQRYWMAPLRLVWRSTARMEMLIRAGADVNDDGSGDYHPLVLYHVISRHQLHIVRWLVRVAHAHTYYPDGFPYRGALEHAWTNSSLDGLECVCLLLDLEVQSEPGDPEEVRRMHAARFWCCVETVAFRRAALRSGRLHKDLVPDIMRRIWATRFAPERVERAEPFPY